MFKKFVLEIEIGNDAMKTRGDVADAISILVKTIRYSGSQPLGSRDEGKITDANGNSVGYWRLERE